MGGKEGVCMVGAAVNHVAKAYRRVSGRREARCDPHKTKRTLLDNNDVSDVLMNLRQERVHGQITRVPPRKVPFTALSTS